MFGVFILLMCTLLLGRTGGWSIGYGIILILSGFIVVIAGLVQGVRGIFTDSKSNLAKTGLILNSLIFIFCLFAMR